MRRSPGESENEHEALLKESRRPLKRAEFELLVDAGAFEEENLELLHGRLVAMSPEGALHAEVVARLIRILARALPESALIRPGAPFAASELSLPQPDVAVVEFRDYSEGHPSALLLAIEVSESSLRTDRKVKSGIYASAKVPEYWIIDLRQRTVEIRTEPAEGAYRKLRTARTGESVSLVSFPEVVIAVSEFFRRY